jgi:hypothetical protein
MTQPDTPAVTESLSEWLVRRVDTHLSDFRPTATGKSVIADIWPLIEAALQKRDREETLLIDALNRGHLANAKLKRDLAEAQQLLQAAVEVLEEFDWHWLDKGNRAAHQWSMNRLWSLLENLKAHTKEAGS